MTEEKDRWESFDPEGYTRDVMVNHLYPEMQGIEFFKKKLEEKHSYFYNCPVFKSEKQ